MKTGAFTSVIGKICLLVLSALFLLSGCTSVDVNLPEPIVESPEVVGATWRPALGVGYMNTHTVSAVNNGSSRPPVLQAQDENGDGDIAFDGDMGLFRRFQVGVRLGPISPIGFLEAKYQILGSPLFESDTAGEFIPKNDSESERYLLAIFSRVGTGSRSASGQQKDLFGAGGFPWNATAQLGVIGAGFSFGYRFTPAVSAFAGGAFDRYHVHASVSQDPSSDGSSQGGQYAQDYDGSASTFAMGVTWGRRIAGTGYVAGTRLAWPNVDSTLALRVGFDVKFVIPF